MFTQNTVWWEQITTGGVARKSCGGICIGIFNSNSEYKDCCHCKCHCKCYFYLDSFDYQNKEQRFKTNDIIRMELDVCRQELKYFNNDKAIIAIPNIEMKNAKWNMAVFVMNEQISLELIKFEKRHVLE